MRPISFCIRRVLRDFEPSLSQSFAVNSGRGINGYRQSIKETIHFPLILPIIISIRFLTGMASQWFQRGEKKLNLIKESSYFYDWKCDLFASNASIISRYDVRSNEKQCHQF